MKLRRLTITHSRKEDRCAVVVKEMPLIGIEAADPRRRFHVYPHAPKKIRIGDGEMSVSPESSNEMNPRSNR